MAGCVLSLNQGFTQYQDLCGADSLAERKLKEGATLAASYLDVPPGFIKGEIDHAATGDLGRGYERERSLAKCIRHLSRHRILYWRIFVRFSIYTTPCSHDLDLAL